MGDSLLTSVIALVVAALIFGGDIIRALHEPRLAALAAAKEAARRNELVALVEAAAQIRTRSH